MAMGYVSKKAPCHGGDSRSGARRIFGVPCCLVLMGLVVGLGLGCSGPNPASKPVRNGPTETVEEKVTLVFCGDIMLSRNVARSIEGDPAKDFTFPFAVMAPWLREADIAFANLESPISGRGEKIEKAYTFNAPPEAIEGLVYAGFDVLSLANNHVLDFGTVAMEDTVKALEDNAIRDVGIAEGDTPQVPPILAVRDLSIGYLAYCDPVPAYSYAREFLAFNRRPASGTEENIARDIALLRERADIIVVSMHWGIEYKSKPDEHQVALGRFIIDAGANIVAGHHPHVQQEPEFYNEGIILYSMGNFVFDQYSRPPTRISRLYRVVIEKNRDLKVEYLPLEIPIRQWQPRPTADDFIVITPAAESPDEEEV